MLKVFRTIKNNLVSKIIERKIKKMYGYTIDVNFSEVDFRKNSGNEKIRVKTEIILNKEDYKKIVNQLFKKGH